MMLTDQSVESVAQCILCTELEGVPDERFSRLLGLTHPYGVKRCPGCGLRWLSPRPTATAYAELYSNEHYFGEGDVVESYAELARRRVDYFLDRLIRIEKYFPEERPLDILDVGAATGEFVHEARERGHRARGIEFSEDARRVAEERYGFELSGHPLEDEPNPGGYDVIHMNHVFEHLPEPRASLSACRNLLKPNGLLVVEVPREFYNDLDRLKKILHMAKTPRFNAYSLHHTYFYTPETLSRLFVSHGFSIERLTTANPARTPLRPFRLRNLLLRIYLAGSDFLHRGGNIIEVFARLPSRSAA